MANAGILARIPTLLVLLERSTRILLGFHKVPASLEVLDDDTVVISANIPHYRLWPYKAGQYVLLQVPQISFFQWHPFTISTCIGNEMQVHIKTDGDWTAKLRGMAGLKYVGIDGPFGAPAQRFYDFDQAMVVGPGIGVTPFSGILTDLQSREDHHWSQGRRHSRSASRTTSRRPSVQSEKAFPEDSTAGKSNIDLSRYRRVDFHWIVPDKNHLLWFSDLLTLISSGPHNPNLDIRIQTHVTQKRKNIGKHVFRWLLEKHRTKDHPASPLTGLINPTRSGRPDLPAIMDRHYEEMLELFRRDGKRKRRVGVFFCGAPVIGHQLADLCQELTLRRREEVMGVEYHFMMKVFG